MATDKAAVNAAAYYREHGYLPPEWEAFEQELRDAGLLKPPVTGEKTKTHSPKD